MWENNTYTQTRTHITCAPLCPTLALQPRPLPWARFERHKRVAYFPEICPLGQTTPLRSNGQGERGVLLRRCEAHPHGWPALVHTIHYCHSLNWISPPTQAQAQGRGCRTTAQNTLTKLTGPRLVVYETHWDVPACRSANCSVAGLLALQRVPGEVSIWLLDHCHDVITLQQRYQDAISVPPGPSQNVLQSCCLPLSQGRGNSLKPSPCSSRSSQ